MNGCERLFKTIFRIRSLMLSLCFFVQNVLLDVKGSLMDITIRLSFECTRAGTVHINNIESSGWGSPGTTRQQKSFESTVFP